MIAVKYAPARLLKMSPLRVTNVAWNWLFSCKKDVNFKVVIIDQYYVD